MNNPIPKEELELEYTAKSCYEDTVRNIEGIIWDRIRHARDVGKFETFIDLNYIPLEIVEDLEDLGFEVRALDTCYTISWKYRIIIVNGNIFNCNEEIIVHQTNCQGVMGHGIALQIRNRHPEVYDAYKEYCNHHIPEDILGHCFITSTNDRKYVANVFGQLNYGEGLQTDYKKLRSGLKEVRTFALSHGLSVAIPYKIGCGLVHGDWNIVYNIINEVFADIDCTIYRYEITGDKYD